MHKLASESNSVPTILDTNSAYMFTHRMDSAKARVTQMTS